MAKLTVVQNLKKFLFASNIKYEINFCLECDLLVAAIDKYVVLVKFLNPQTDYLYELNKHFPNVKHLKVDVMPVAKAISSGDYDNIVILAEGSPFQARVWNALLTIPRGSTMYYSEIAALAGNAAAVRAAATAVGKNPVPLVIPCHRVIGKANPYKFGGGEQLKKHLLEHEGVFFNS